MATYTIQNGRAAHWQRDHERITLARWVYHNPERFAAFVHKLTEYGIDLLDIPAAHDNDTFIHQLDELTTDNILDIIEAVLDIDFENV